MWFVDDVASNGSGSFNSPFNSLASVESQFSQVIIYFLFLVVNQNLLLKNNQKLYGAAENDLSFPGLPYLYPPQM